MNINDRLQFLEKQQRAYITGTVECIENQWIFFDEINEKAYQLIELEREVEIFYNNQWIKGILEREGILNTNNHVYYLHNGDEIRYKKPLIQPYKELLEDLSQETFDRFIQTLNQLSYSIYDCIYCHNFLSLIKMRKVKTGVNIMTFDNEDMICNVQHHFEHDVKKRFDRLEFTLSNGKRVICQHFSH